MSAKPNVDRFTLDDPNAKSILVDFAAKRGLDPNDALAELVKLIGSDWGAQSARYLQGSWPTATLQHRYIYNDMVMWSDIGGSRPAPSMSYLSTFQTKIESAAVLMSCAFVEAAVTDFRPASRRTTIRADNPATTFYVHVVNNCLDRFRDVRNALMHQWTPTPQADLLASQAFEILVAMTPAADHLHRIHAADPARARKELARLLDPIADEVEATAQLMAKTGDDQRTEPSLLESNQTQLLEKAGGYWSLSEAAEALDITRQGVHKKVRAGAVLGVMRGKTFAIPRGQFEQTGVRFEATPGLGKIVKLFREAEAGDWAALQFLVEHDPNLGATPLEALRAGRKADTTIATRAYLGLDES